VSGGEAVLLVHGLWLHGIAMKLMRRRLERCGYEVHTPSYPTVRCTLHENAEALVRYSQGMRCTRLHLVGHSLGGLVALTAARGVPAECRGRIVLIGTPFADSFSGRVLQRFGIGRALLGKCMLQWLQEPRPEVPGDFELGVIAGDGGIGLGRIVARGLPKPHDGVVSVVETEVPAMRDHITLPVSHSQMLVSPEVVRQTGNFIAHARFDHQGMSPA
jgi:pimeloyl-ACP methyl ester carboxylesterase